jgi:hypothetical protein
MHGDLEDFAGMNVDPVEPADGGRVKARHAVVRIAGDDHQVLPVRVGQIVGE